MKCSYFVLKIASALLLVGCATTPVFLVPVGPNPISPPGPTADGALEVFSALQERRDGNEFDANPAWYQHTDYMIYSASGRRIRHVFNSVGHYAQSPRLVTMSPGRYLVNAEAKGFLRVWVPVVVEPGRTTKIHLDAKWTPAAGIPTTELVSAPSGYPVGWRMHKRTPAAHNG